MKKKKICFITERRADYSRLKPVLLLMKKSKKLEPCLIVTGTHLLEDMGHTVDLIKKDGFTINAVVPMFTEFDQDDGASMSTALGKAIIGITKALQEIKPDMVIVGFDLGAHLATAIAAAHMNIPIAHIQGGEVTGTIDESLRHAITKFSHIHFASTEKSKERIIKMGEDPQFVFNVGCPVVDMILQTNLKTKEELHQELQIDISKPLILVIQHPVVSEVDQSRDQILTTLDAIREVNKDNSYEVVLIYSNIDAGGKQIIKEKEKSGIKLFKNLTVETFLSLLKYTSVLVGNSSSGIREAPSFRVPVVNIGTRQQGRERAANVIDVDYKKEEIVGAIRKALYDETFKQNVRECTNPYGDGKAAERIVKILETLDFPKEKIQKRIAY